MFWVPKWNESQNVENSVVVTAALLWGFIWYLLSTMLWGIPHPHNSTIPVLFPILQLRKLSLRSFAQYHRAYRRHIESMSVSRSVLCIVTSYLNGVLFCFYSFSNLYCSPLSWCAWGEKHLSISAQNRVTEEQEEVMVSSKPDKKFCKSLGTSATLGRQLFSLRAG